MAPVASNTFSTRRSRLLVVAAATLAWCGAAVAAGTGGGPRPAPVRQTPTACIAIVLPSVRGIEGNATEMGSVVRQLFESYLKGPSLQAVELEARLASQATAEARQKECGHVLTATLTRRRGGSGVLGKVLGGAAGSAAWHIPGGATVGSALARGAAWGAAQAVASLASTTRAKDELRLEYRLSSAAGATELGPKTDTLKAKVDGEDLLTPLVEKAAEAIVAAVVKG